MVGGSHEASGPKIVGHPEMGCPFGNWNSRTKTCGSPGNVFSFDPYPHEASASGPAIVSLEWTGRNKVLELWVYH